MTSAAEQDRAPTAEEEALPLVIVTRDFDIDRGSVIEEVKRAGCRARIESVAALLDGGERLDPVPQLLIVSLPWNDACDLLEFTRRVRHGAAPQRLPILGVVDDPGTMTTDLAALRTAGLSGLVNLSAGREHFCRRIALVTRPLAVRAREARLPCFIPAQVRVDGHHLAGVVVSLSPGGVRLALPQALESNTRIGLRFQLPKTDSEVTLDGRVTFLAPASDALHDFEVGVAFLDVAPEVTDRLIAALAAILREIEC